MKKGVMIALVTFLCLAGPAFGCLDCYLVDVPDPDGGRPSPTWTCLNLTTDGWYICTTGGLMGFLFGCYTQDVCLGNWNGWPPVP
jgi:hypothetical protein